MRHEGVRRTAVDEETGVRLLASRSGQKPFGISVPILASHFIKATRGRIIIIWGNV